MWYVPYLRVRRAMFIYACVVIAVTLAAIALRCLPGAVHVDPSNRPSHHNIALLVSAGAALVGGFATVLGLNLAAENDGHLELAWTKPVSREGYALGVFAVDIAAMAVCIVFTALFVGIAIDVFVGRQAIEFDGAGLGRALLFCGLPLCVYAWIAALSAFLKRNRGASAGLFWPLMVAVALLRLSTIPIVHSLGAALSVFNPLEIYTTGTDALGTSPWMYAWGWALAALLLAAALVQWRRLEL